MRVPRTAPGEEAQPAVKWPGFGVHGAQVQIPGLLFPTYVTVGGTFPLLSETQFLYLQNGGKNNICLI